MTNTPLSRRIARIEASRRPSEPAMPCTWIVTESDEDQARQLAEREAAGTYKRGWPLIAWRVVDPLSRPPTESLQ